MKCKIALPAGRRVAFGMVVDMALELLDGAKGNHAGSGTPEKRKLRGRMLDVRLRSFPAVPVLTVLVALWSCGAATSHQDTHILHHDLSVRLLPKTQSIEGSDTLTVAPGGDFQLVFNLNAGARIRSVSMSGKPLPFSFESGRLKASLPDSKLEPQVRLTITYGASFRDPAPLDPVNTEDPSYGVTGTIAEEGVFLSPHAGWYPDIPGSTATFLARIEAPAGFHAVTTGKRLDIRENISGTSSVWEVAHPVRGISLSAGPYTIAETDVDGIPVYTYFSAANHSLSDRYLNAAADHLRSYNLLFGPYPFSKFAVVENFFPTGYGFPSYTLLGSTVLRLPFIPETSLGHEIAHSWWGNSVYVDHGHGNWAEGLTTYVSDYLYKERASRKEARDYRLQILRDYASLVPPEKDFALSAFTGRFSPASRAVGYGKGAMVFHMVRRLTGDEPFWQALRTLFRKKRFHTASWTDFARTFQDTSGRNFAPFFKQWVERPGAPTLSLEAVKKERTGPSEWKVTGLIRQEKPYYDLQIPLRLETELPASAESTQDFTLPVSNGATPFTIHSTAVPRRLVVDPEADLFRRLHSPEIPPTVNDIRASSSVLVVAAGEGPPEMVEASKDLFPALGLEPGTVSIISEQEFIGLSGSLGRSRDILYIGAPREELAPDSLPEGFSLSPDRFSVEGVTFDEPEDALFLTLPSPFDERRVMAVFLPLSTRAAQASVRKIPHYGKYSYLVFRGGVNRIKSTLPLEASPLTYDFSTKEALP